MNIPSGPRSRLLLPLFTCATLALCACSDEEATPQEPVDVPVMTRNLYLGGNIFELSQAKSAQEVPVIAARLYATVRATNFPQRAEALAKEIETAKPALVGMQEVSLYRTQHPSDYLSNGLVNAPNVEFDFLAILMAELQKRGLDYRVAAKVKNGDSELPAALSGNANDLTDIRLTDYDVILARGDVTTAGVVEKNYTKNQQVPVGGSTVTFLRGFTKVDATVDGASFTFVNSHMEGLMPANDDQSKEMVEILGGYANPLMLVGDLNTGPGSPTPAYGTLASAANLIDSWTKVSEQPGFTCCVSANVNDTTTTGFDERIDLVLYRGEQLEPISGEVVGDELTDRTASGLWPSDHAGMVMTFRVQR
jgi:endonuclease/exonuclease/phosphatase family metal-dependent hydrolase